MPTFKELCLQPNILSAIEFLGFTTPTNIQSEIIPIILNQSIDVVGLAQTGTGKTAAFGLPILQHTDTSDLSTQTLILSPTRELCMQISKDLERYAKDIKNIKIVPIYGGANFGNQIEQISKGAQIIVATPGRLNDMIRRKKVDLSKVKRLVLDEADEMLHMGFQEDLDAILEQTPKTKNTYLFSATMPAEVERILSKYMVDPKIVSIGKRNSGTENIKHIYYTVHAKDRYTVLKRIADFYPDIYAIIFCRTRKETQDIADMLIKDGYSSDALHGDLSQAARENVMARFRSKTLQMLVATDVAARGLDVNNLTHVINYNLPDEPEIYIHRSGRTGRADKTGISISILNMREKSKLKHIEKKLDREFIQAKIPTGYQVCEKQLFHHIDRMENVEVNNDIEQFLPVIFKKLQWLDREDIIRKFVSLEFNRFLEYYKGSKDLNANVENKDFEGSKSKENGKNKASSRNNKDKGGSKGFTKLFFGFGKVDKAAPQKIIGLINDVTKTRDVKVGHIDIYDKFSLIEINNDSVNKVLKSFSSEDKNPYNIRVKISNEELDNKGNRKANKSQYENKNSKKKFGKSRK